MLKPHNIFCGILMVFLGVSTAMAKGPSLPHGKWWANPQMFEQLNLNDEEKHRLDEEFIKLRRNLIDLKSRVEKEQLELEIVMDKQDADQTAIIKQFKKLETARTDLAAERFGFVLAVRNILGFERFEQLKTTFKDHRKRSARNDKKNADRRPRKKHSETPAPEKQL